ncbi:Sel1-repeat-containing protein YbeT [compost metagenome]
MAYLNGIGVEIDAPAAVRWFRKAAEQGNADAQFFLGIAYARGDGVEQDLSAAAEWYAKAAAQGMRKAQELLAKLPEEYRRASQR